MTPEVLVDVTESFFVTNPQGDGTGFGLAIARGFSEQTGDKMLIDSQARQETTVNIWLPVAVATATATPDEVSAPIEAEGPNKTARLLVVDDEPLVRELITQQLGAAGHSIISAAGPHEALASLDFGASTDLVVSDLSMPGIALMREVSRRRPELLAILLTGSATNAAETTIGGALNDLFSLLRKLVTEQELAERVALLLEGTAKSGVTPH